MPKTQPKQKNCAVDYCMLLDITVTKHTSWRKRTLKKSSIKNTVFNTQMHIDLDTTITFADFNYAKAHA